MRPRHSSGMHREARRKNFEAIRKAISVAKNPNTPAEVLEELANNNFRHGAYEYDFIAVAVAENPNTPVRVLEKLANGTLNPWLISALARNPNTPDSIHFEKLLKWLYLNDTTVHYSGFSGTKSPKPKKIIAVLDALKRKGLFSESADFELIDDEIKVKDFCKSYKYVIMNTRTHGNLGYVHSFFYAIEMEKDNKKIVKA